ncbi:FAD-dependent monooxygenase [Listeria ilorinensis]|uniref:FAD-dependent monooxygenase n=1 Tax=Listeria ilorinensis TaxID=2867439 RepID=UPI001EF739AF|nr:FAD-dependent monooxygenase [Listeria ilorinensis]
MRQRFLINGAGIAGMAMALFLQQNKEVEVCLLEAQEEVDMLEIGITIAPNGMRILEQLGLREQIEAVAKFSRDGLVIADRKGEPLTKFHEAAGGNRIWALSKADLKNIMLGALDPGVLRLGQHVTDVIQTREGVQLEFADGSQLGGDYLIAADGMRSIVRQQMFEQNRLRFTGGICFRGIIPKQPVHVAPDRFMEYWGKTGRVGIVPLPEQRTYWFAVLTARKDSVILEDYQSADLLAHFMEMPPDVTEVLHLAKSQPILREELYELETLDTYANGRVVLIGDAAHAMTPNTGQGGNQALEDAFILAQLLHTSQVEKAFEMLNFVRRERVTKIAKLSRFVGRVGQIRNPLLISLRNSLMRRVPADFQHRKLAEIYELETDR